MEISDMVESGKKSRNEQLALYHARLIQERKDIEAKNLQAIELLMELPSAATRDCRAPTLEDTEAVRHAMKAFSTADFDSAVEERNISDKCGYALCPQPKPQPRPRSLLRSLRRGSDPSAHDAAAADDADTWCSAECTKRALYLRVQLSDTPVWERAGLATTELQLYGEYTSPYDGWQEQVRALTADLRQLALERGDPDHEAPRSGTLDGDVRESGQ